ncbi:zinc-binding alcohol dehydrogenase [Halopenitus sp. H-Gu1]|uniref:zinc-dependent alcohol dehydrogenase n=1 Tax=Halopenitus sp. H-Gu1 TaxID=3242697 RepID=UPI00359E52FD
MTGRAVYFVDDRSIEVRPVDVPSPGAEELLVETDLSAISSGTELLVYRDETPAVPVDETLDAFEGGFEYPMRYGYAAAGTVTDVGTALDDGWLGESVFAFHPHQSRFTISPTDVVALPEEVSSEAGALLPSMETATNLVLDAHPRVGERVVVFGAGVIGLCVIHVLAGFPLERLVVVDPIDARREIACKLGADVTRTPEALVTRDLDADLAIEVSGRPGTLDDAIDAVGYDSRIVVGSWYGTKRAPIDLGGRFHRDRIEVVSSQVSTIHPELRGRWDKSRRIDVALDRLERFDPETVITHRMPLAEAPTAYDLLDGHPDEALQVLLTYP